MGFGPAQGLPAASFSGTVPATSGGTGQTTYTIGDLLYASSATALSKLASSTAGLPLLAGGAGVAPAYGTLGVAAGGTNLTSYTVGDLIYASGATTLSKLAASTSGYLLTSGGAGVAPAWAAPAAQVWTRTGTTLSPTTANDVVSVTSNAVSGTFASTAGTAFKATSSASQAVLRVDTTIAQGADVGPEVHFLGLYNASDSITFAKFRGAKVSGVADNYDGYWALYSRANGGGFTECLRGGPSGQLGIGGANYGTSGQVLTSNGNAAAPSWQAAAGGADTRWTTSGSNLYQTTTTDGVSIGTSTNAAASKFQVVGDGTRKHVTFTAGGADGCIDVIVAAGGSSLFRVLDDAGPLLTLRPGGSGTGVLDFRDSDDNARIGQLQWSVGDDAIGFFMTSGRQFEVWHGSTLNLQASSAGTSVGVASLATDATDGFIYVPACAGTPTGVPTGITGFAPIVVNTTNHKLYFYSGGSWRDAGP